jgi:hypothetical protein
VELHYASETARKYGLYRFQNHQKEVRQGLTNNVFFSKKELRTLAKTQRYGNQSSCSSHNWRQQPENESIFYAYKDD